MANGNSLATVTDFLGALAGEPLFLVMGLSIAALLSLLKYRKDQRAGNNDLRHLIAWGIITAGMGTPSVILIIREIATLFGR